MVGTPIRLTEEQAETLKSVPAERRISVAALARECVGIYMRRFRAVSPEERRGRALSVIGRFDSGIGDLSREHDRYFVDSILEEP